MTKALESAIARLKTLPENQQDALTILLIDEIDEDARWEATTTAHPEQVAKLAAQVQAACERGECEPLDPDNL